tara:strand:+ start:538 stop:1638 length:1101 start_codon:yes stop_codon:yes gene_type:complete
VFFLSISFIISLVVFGNQFVLTLQESVEHGIPIQELMPVVSFNMIRDIPIILTLSIFLSIIFTISQLYKSSEAIILNSIGLGDKKFIQMIKPVIIFSFMLVCTLSLYAVPWAKQQKSIIESKTVNASEFSFISEGKFESFKNDKIVFYASESKKIDINDQQNMEEIFIYATIDEKAIIVLASEAIKYLDSESKSIYLRLKDGVRYEGLPGSESIKILDFDLYDLEIVPGEVQKSLSNVSTIEESSTIQLIKDNDNLSNAELQWRISQPISVLILSVLGVFLGKSSPRTGKGVNLLIGIVVFMLYNNGLLVAKSSIENGQLNPIIGLWSIHLFLIIFLFFFYQSREGKIIHFIDKILIFNNKEKSHV